VTNLAIFDIDGTLLRGSSERRFWRYLWAQRRQGPRQLLAYLLFLLRYVPVGGIHTIKKNKAYLTGLSTATIERLAADFVATDFPRNAFAPVVARLKQHLARGDAVLLLSGTLQPIADALAHELGVKHVCATLCEEIHGTYRSGPPDRHPFYHAKVPLARDFAAQHNLDLSRATAYSDSYHDTELLESMGSPVVVEGDRKLLSIALARRWEVIWTHGDTGAPLAPHGDAT
jgi:HAD superfamily phosphoserine phosphatase-like hydrolase